MPLADGATFAGYTIVRLLGAGGMGEVYLAQHPRLPRRDALKVLPASVSADNEYRERFHREADIAATLWHPHIGGVHDRGDFEGQIWISMDYVEGTDAARMLRERTPTGCPTKSPRSSLQSPTLWIMRISATCCTAMSNPPTSCSLIPSRVSSESCWVTSESHAGPTISAV